VNSIWHIKAYKKQPHCLHIDYEDKTYDRKFYSLHEQEFKALYNEIEIMVKEKDPNFNINEENGSELYKEHVINPCCKKGCNIF
jgi:hypothetical protein